MMVATQPLPAIDATMVRHARRLGSQSGKSVVAELETLTAASPHDLVRALAASFGMGVLETAQMLALMPVSDVLPLSQAMQRVCALLRTPNRTPSVKGLAAAQSKLRSSMD